MDTRYGKYDGPAAALAEHWHMDGDTGAESYVNEGDGSGSILYRGPFTLSGSEVAYLRAEHDVTGEEMSALEVELSTARGLLFSWDSQGFLYGRILATDADYAEAETAIREDNDAEAEDAEAEADHAPTPSPYGMPSGVFGTCAHCSVPVWREDHEGNGWTSLEGGTWRHVETDEAE